MKKNYRIRLIVLFLSFLLASVILAGCSGSGAKSRKPPGDFSRGLPFTVRAISPPAASVSPSGNKIQVIIPYQKQDQGYKFRYYQLDELARIIIDQDLSLELDPFIRSLKMIDVGEISYLVWAARGSTSEGWGLRYAAVDNEAEIISQPKWISQDTERVSQFTLAADPQGDLLVIWENSSDTSIHFTNISSQGDILVPANLLIPFGDRPALIPAPEGGFHLVWMQGENLNYSAIKMDLTFPILGDQLVRIRVGRGNSLDGPVVGISNNLVYVFWSIIRQTGLEAGTAITEYLVFPPDQPGRNQSGLLTIYPVSEDLLQPYQGQLNLSQVVPRPREDYLSTDYIYDPRTNLGFDDTQIVAVVANQNIRLDSYTQVVIGIFDDGEYQGYTVGTKTTELSKNPIIAVDAGGNLHLIWQEGASGDRIYYATTKPEARAQLDKILLGDLPTLFLSGGLEAVTGILLFPFAFPWMALGLLIMVILRLSRNDEDVTQGLSKILLALAILSYQVSKLLFLPDILVYVPFSAWLDLPENLNLVMKVLVPILIFVVAMVAAEWGRRRRQSPTSSLRYYITVILIDTLFTLSVYGVVFLGEY